VNFHFAQREGEENFLHPGRTCPSLRAAVVVDAVDERGQADSFERKISVLQNALTDLLVEKKFGFPAHRDIIFDSERADRRDTGLGGKNNANYDRGLSFAAERSGSGKSAAREVRGGHSAKNISFRSRQQNTRFGEAMHKARLIFTRLRRTRTWACPTPELLEVYEEGSARNYGKRSRELC